MQAIFRAYRIGQEKNVHVYRLVASGTMENRIYSNQLLKQGLFLRVVDEQSVSRSVSGAQANALFEYNSNDDLSQSGSDSDDDDKDDKDDMSGKKKKRKSKKKKSKAKSNSTPKKERGSGEKAKAVKEEISEEEKIKKANAKAVGMFTEDDDVIVIEDSDNEAPKEADTADPVASQGSSHQVDSQREGAVPDWYDYEVCFRLFCIVVTILCRMTRLKLCGNHPLASSISRTFEITTPSWRSPKMKS
jgi:hypothetical protein